MVGMERTIFPQFADVEFGIDSKTAILSFITAFGLSKALANYYTGKLANKFGRKNLLLVGWLIDVRSKEEYEKMHINEAINIPMQELENSILQLDKNINYITVCGKGGGRSAESAKILEKLGYKSK